MGEVFVALDGPTMATSPLHMNAAAAAAKSSAWAGGGVNHPPKQDAGHSILGSCVVVQVSRATKVFTCGYCESFRPSLLLFLALRTITTLPMNAHVYSKQQCLLDCVALRPTFPHTNVQCMQFSSPSLPPTTNCTRPLACIQRQHEKRGWLTCSVCRGAER